MLQGAGNKFQRLGHFLRSLVKKRALFQKRSKLFFRVPHALFQTLDLTAAIEEARLLPLSAAARKRAAGVQQFAVKRHDAQSPAHLLLNGKAVIERIDDERAGQ